MLSDEETRALFRDTESDRIERKRSAQEISNIAKAVCAYANDLPRHEKPGVVFVGVEDDGTCSGLEISDELLRRLSQLRNDGRILPFPVMTVQKRSIDSCEVAVISVNPSDNPPVRFNGRCWIRIGPRRAQATAEEERTLTEKRRWGNAPYDMHGIPNSAESDLDLKRFELEYLPSVVPQEVLEANDRPIQLQLKSLRLLTKEGIPTVTAILSIGKEPRNWIPGAYIQFVRYDGVSVTDPVKDQKEISGVLSDQLRQIDEVLKANISVRLIFSDGNREERPDYPIVALQQLVRNSVMHRNYEHSANPVRVVWFTDRVEISSPGSSFGMVSRENFGQPGVTDYRNPTVAEALKGMGFVDRFGRGIPLAVSELKRNGNPELEFNVEDTYVLVTVRPVE